MEKESRSGSMAQNMKAPGRMTKPMEKVSSYMLVEIFMMGCGAMIKQMDRVRSITPMGPCTKATGLMIISRVKALNPGQMAPSILVITIKATSTVKAILFKLMNLFMMVHLSITISMDMESTYGLISTR